MEWLFQINFIFALCRQETVFKIVICHYEVPSKIRTDRGGENQFVHGKANVRAYGRKKCTDNP